MVLGVAGQVGQGGEPGSGGVGGVAGLDEQGPGAALAAGDSAGGDAEEDGQDGRGRAEAQAQHGGEGLLGEVERVLLPGGRVAPGGVQGGDELVPLRG